MMGGVVVVEQIATKRYAPPTEEELAMTERAFMLGWRMRGGERFTVLKIQDEYGMTRSGAWKLLHRVARRGGIVCENGEWFKMP